MSSVKKEHTYEIHGKTDVNHKGLLDLFHKNGGKSIVTEQTKNTKDDGFIQFKATVEGDSGLYTAHGDAHESNVDKMVRLHIVRVAETRAVNRALRWYNNIGDVSLEELGGDN